jgi:hypothetical protein
MIIAFVASVIAAAIPTNQSSGKCSQRIKHGCLLLQETFVISRLPLNENFAYEIMHGIIHVERHFVWNVKSYFVKRSSGIINIEVSRLNEFSLTVLVLVLVSLTFS